MRYLILITMSSNNRVLDYFERIYLNVVDKELVFSSMKKQLWTEFDKFRTLVFEVNESKD